MRRLFALGMFAVTGCTSAAHGTGAASPPPDVTHAADVAEIRSMRAASNAAIARRDALATVESMLPAYRVLPAGAPATISRDSTAASLERQFSDTAMLGYVRTPTSIEVSTTGPTAAELGRWVGRRRRPDGVQETTGSYYAAWRHTPEGWRLQAETFVALACSGSAQCPSEQPARDRRVGVLTFDVPDTALLESGRIVAGDGARMRRDAPDSLLSAIARTVVFSPRPRQ